MAGTSTTSRFKQTSYVIFQGVTSYGAWVMPNIRDITVFQTITTTPDFAGRADKIADVYYGSSNYFWVLLVYNSPTDPLNWPKVGEIIKIPDINKVITET